MMSKTVRTAESIDLKLFGILVSPSFLSALFAVSAGTALIAIPYFMLHASDFAKQNLAGLHQAYAQTGISNNLTEVSQRISGNAQLNNVTLFIMWGSAGAVLFIILRKVVHIFNTADDVVHQLNYVNGNRWKLLMAVMWQAIIRCAALAAWWIVLRCLVFQIVPLGISLAHTTAANELNWINWRNSALIALVCMLMVHIQVVLLRLVVLRPRFFGSVII